MRVAIIQTHLVPGRWEENVEHACLQARSAIAEYRPELILLPEAFAGYVDPDGRHAIEPTDGATASRMTELADEGECLVLFGMLRSTAEGNFNSAVLVSDAGVLGVYDKTHLVLDRDRPDFDEERFFVPGDHLGLFDTPLGRLGVLICHDGSYPEMFRSLVLEGADIICWLLNNCDVRQWAEFHALWNVVPIALANPVATPVFLPSGNRYKIDGSSIIVVGDGKRIADAGRTEPEVLFADLDPARWKAVRANGSGMQAAYQVRRPDLYGSIVSPRSFEPERPASDMRPRGASED